MNLDYITLADLEQDIMEHLTQSITHILSKLNRTGKLYDFLDLIGMLYLQSPVPSYQSFRDGKILIVGDSQISEAVIIAIANSFGIESSRIELCLGYDKARTYRFDRLQYQPQYRVILCGPMPHSIKGKNDSTSMITEMEFKEGYPRVLRLIANDTLKISKTSLKRAFAQLIEESYISAHRDAS